MKQRQQQRLWYLVSCLLGITGIVIIITVACQENLLYFMTPSELLNRANYQSRIRLGGLVEKNSITKDPLTLTTSFIITDSNNRIFVSYTGIVPDLFREGQGVIVDGKLQSNNHFKAERILAKHDENYMPSQVAKKIGKIN